MTTEQRSSIAIITGGSRGLGKSMALQLAERGVHSIITYRSGAREASEVVQAIQARGLEAAALELDVAQSATFGEFAERVRGELKQRWQRDSFDFLVNNAGTGA